MIVHLLVGKAEYLLRMAPVRFWWTTLLMLCSISAVARGSYKDASYRCFPAIFAFGDDWGDTGNLQALFPADLEKLEENPPYGMSYFKKPLRRLSDGRLMLDFFGARYAPSVSVRSWSGVKSTAWSQFRCCWRHLKLYGIRSESLHAYAAGAVASEFVSDVRDALANGTTEPLPGKGAFRNGLYIISTGQNDYRYALIRDGKTDHEVEVDVVPRVVQNITASVVSLSTLFHAKNIMVMNLPPLGCSPEILTRYGRTEVSEYDSMGCLISYNRLTNLHNELLKLRISGLRVTLKHAVERLIYVDMAALVSDVLYDPETCGFQSGLEACCGSGGPYNYNPRVPCGRHGFINGRNVTATPCHDPTQYVNWDGLHTTEAFNRIAVEAILTEHYIDPPMALNCEFNFDEFM